MSAVYNSEAETIARIEALELEVRDLHRRVEQTPAESDRKVLNKQISELKDEITFLRLRLPH